MSGQSSVAPAPSRRRSDDGALPEALHPPNDLPAHQADESWRHTTAAGRFGQWHLDLASKALLCSDTCKADFGLQPSEDLTYARLFELIHADDREHVAARVRQSVAARVAYEAEYRVVWPDGSTHWINARGGASYAPDGTALTMSGLMLDVTERKRAEEELKASNRRLGLLARVSGGLILDAAPRGQVKAAFDTVAEEVGAAFYFNFMVDESRPGLLVLENSAGLTRAQRQAFEHIRFGEYLCGKVARDRQPIVLEDMQLSTDDSAAGVRGLGARAYAGVPLVAHGRLIGTLAYCITDAPRFSGEHVALIKTVADQIAAALDRDQLAGQLATSEARYRLLAEERKRHVEELQTLLEALPVGVFVAQDAACTNITMNPAGAAMLRMQSGVNASKTGTGAGRLPFRVLDKDGVEVPGDDLPMQRAARLAQPVIGEEVDVVFADGGATSLYEHAVPLFDAAGEVRGCLGVFVDITERKQAEARQKLLLDELNHRVKNTLATIQAIAQQTLRTTTDPEQFVASFSGRVLALSRVHTLLTQTTWQGAGLRDLIRAQVVQGPADDGRVAAEGPVVMLEPQLALHLALVLHELGTNSAKYGALSLAGGRVSVSWSVEGSELRLHWVERGGPEVQPSAAPGFGTTLIEQSVKAHQGEARMLREAQGVTWDIMVMLSPAPLERVAASERPAALAVTARPLGQSNGGDNRRASLAGKRILVVEDEPLVALDVVASLESEGVTGVGPAGTAAAALRLIETEEVDAALLDANLKGRPVDEIAAALTRRNIPFAFVTGYDRDSLPRAFRAAPMVSKPFTPEELLAAAERLMSPSDELGQSSAIVGRPA